LSLIILSLRGLYRTPMAGGSDYGEQLRGVTPKIRQLQRLLWCIRGRNRNGRQAVPATCRPSPGVGRP